MSHMLAIYYFFENMIIKNFCAYVTAALSHNIFNHTGL